MRIRREQEGGVTVCTLYKILYIDYHHWLGKAARKKKEKMETEDDKGTGWSNGMYTNIKCVLNSFFLSVWYWHHGGIRTRPATLNHHHCLAITIFWISVKQDKLPGAIIVIFHPKNNDVCIYLREDDWIKRKRKRKLQVWFYNSIPFYKEVSFYRNCAAASRAAL